MEPKTDNTDKAYEDFKRRDEARYPRTRKRIEREMRLVGTTQAMWEQFWLEFGKKHMKHHDRT